MINEKKLIEEIRQEQRGLLRESEKDNFACEVLEQVIRIVNEQPKTDWIPCEERLPKEHDGYYSELIRMGLKNYSYDQCSDDVLVTVELNDGQTVIARSQTFDGEWEYEWRTKEVGYNKVKRVRNGHKVIAWQPLPQPYKKEGESNADS